jgi:hypothetical protein
MSRVWTYVIPRQLPQNELQELKQSGDNFVKEWTAHENKLSATFDIVRDRVILVRVNEDVHGASGCSIDKLTRFIRSAGESIGADLLDRMQVAYEGPKSVEVIAARNVPSLLESGTLTPDTLVYDTTIFSDEQLQEFKKPLKSTWLNRYLPKY